MSNLSISHPEIITKPSPRLSEAIQQGSKDDVLAAMDATAAVKRKVEEWRTVRGTQGNYSLSDITDRGHGETQDTNTPNGLRVKDDDNATQDAGMMPVVHVENQNPHMPEKDLSGIRELEKLARRVPSRNDFGLDRMKSIKAKRERRQRMRTGDVEFTAVGFKLHDDELIHTASGKVASTALNNASGRSSLSHGIDDWANRYLSVQDGDVRGSDGPSRTPLELKTTGARFSATGVLPATARSTFPNQEIITLMEEAVDRVLGGPPPVPIYDQTKAHYWCNEISKWSVEHLNGYEALAGSRLIATTTIKQEGHNVSGGLETVTGCIWDKTRDSSITLQWSGPNMFCVHTVYCVE